MKTKHLNSGIAFVVASLSFSLSLNSKALSVGEPKISEAARVNHAKELLGPTYLGSTAQNLEGSEDLNKLITRKVRRSLKPQFKAHASEISRAVIEQSSIHGFDPIFVLAVIKTESRFNPKARGQFGEIGLMQLKPETARWIAKKYDIPWSKKHSLENPILNIRVGVAYMDYLRNKFKGKPGSYISAYNMGAKNVRRLLSKNITPQIYSNVVMKNYSEIYLKMASHSFPAVATIH